MGGKSACAQRSVGGGGCRSIIARQVKDEQRERGERIVVTAFCQKHIDVLMAVFLGVCIHSLAAWAHIIRTMGPSGAMFTYDMLRHARQAKRQAERSGGGGVKSQVQWNCTASRETDRRIEHPAA